ncbi:amylo-alpha-1,6-glucosidase [Pseudalkalibacillus decolorationis]|uniref:amylo-alpha-1,6-glucosidase n=1 Tax=Pseudalkalibacillus decolorationis TaxID=163879 RepID=UPI00214944AC|nr:trehalase family glycosidase [Pseudalkalibacillus decolorationis]
MNFNLNEVPFSRYGSYIVISPLHSKDKNKDLYIRNIRGGDNDLGAVFRIELVYKGKRVPYKVTATPTLLRLDAEEGYMELCIYEPQFLRVRGKGVGLRLSANTGAYDYAMPVQNGRWEVNSFEQEIRYMVTPLKGLLNVDAPWVEQKCEHIILDLLPGEETGEMECAIEEFHTVWTKQNYETDFETCHRLVDEEYQKWMSNTLQVADQYMKGKELAAYITWSCVVNPEGYLSRPAMYMSKNWMTNIWSWDHCFNAMALVKSNPELAWDQFMIFFDKQDESGVLPDFMNDRFALWNCCKPPIHGWTLRWMMERTDYITKERLKEVYEPLIRWTEWWFDHRDDDNDGVPQYNHGNDSGWDNSTVFQVGSPVESPDLCAFLIMQMDVLSDIAAQLGLQEDEKKWLARANETLDRMIDHCWDYDQFKASRSGCHTMFESKSLVLFMPIILGKRLPESILSHLIKGLKENGRFFTKHGLATESINSQYYCEDGYWRGPIWAPTTMLIHEGLNSSGENVFATDVARRFCNMAAKSGMAENFNALTGKGLRDRAFTWTSSVFLVLANELFAENSGK